MSPLDVLARYWGYDAFRPCQGEIVQSVLDGHDTIGLMPTGGGKSITFQVPAMMLDGLTLVITPLISLMKDQVDNLREVGIRAGCLHSGLTAAETRYQLDRAALGRAKILYIAPEKLASPRFMAEVSQWNVSMIVVDEAHCISQWGYDFRPSYMRIVELRKLFPDAPVMALTASATPRVVADIADKLQMRAPAVFKRSFSRDNISYVVRHTPGKEAEMLHILQCTAGSAIVYVRSRRRTSMIAQYLTSCGISADFYHAGLDSKEKEAKQDAWKSGAVRVMVATNAFGMGIDKPDVRLVIHYDLPPSLEEYYQEAGRAGRDGLTSYAVMLAATPDKATLRKHLHEAFPPRPYILEVYDKICVFLNVAVGGGYNQLFECNIEAFCHTFGMQRRPVVAALGILTRAGIVEFSEEIGSRARLMITIDKRAFYSLQLTESTDKVLTTIMRMYPGLFADFIPIDEVAIAYAASVSPHQVYEELLLLSRMHVVQYVPRRIHPSLFFPTSRELSKHLVIPRTVYEDRMACVEQRVNAMIDYAFNDDTCRVERMLRYFGDDFAAPCGKCDVCREHKKAAQPEPESLTDKIDRLVVRDEGLAASDIPRLFGDRAAQAFDYIRTAVDDGRLRFIDGIYRR